MKLQKKDHGVDELDETELELLLELLDELSELASSSWRPNTYTLAITSPPTAPRRIFADPATSKA